MILLPDGFISRMSSSIHKQLSPRGKFWSGRMQNLASQAGSDSGLHLPGEASTELRQHSDLHSNGVQVTSRYQKEMPPYEEAPTIPHEWRV